MSKANNLLLRLSTLEIIYNIVERQAHIKFLGVFLDENLSCSPHINTIQIKIAKNIGLLYEARNLIDSNCLKQLSFSYTHSYLTYANITWRSTRKSNLMGLYR